MNYLPNGTRVIILDDDITSIKIWKLIGESKYGKLINISKQELFEILDDCFENTIKLGNNKFGICSVANTMVIKSTIASQGIYSINKIFQGCFFGFIVDDKIRFDEDMPVLDDYEIVLRDIYQGKDILRRNDLIVSVAKLGSNKGGCQDAYSNGKQKEALIKLYKKYYKIMNIKKDFSGIILKRG